MEIGKETIICVHVSTCMCFLETAMLGWILPHPSIIHSRTDAICFFSGEIANGLNHSASGYSIGGTVQEACFPLTSLEKRTVTFQLHSELLSNILNCNLVITINVALNDYLMKEIMPGTSIIMAPSSLPPTYLEKFPTVVESGDEQGLPVLNNRFHTRFVKTCCFWSLCVCVCVRAHTHTDTHTYTSKT